jgi:hypothetical protein
MRIVVDEQFSRNLNGGATHRYLDPEKEYWCGKAKPFGDCHLTSERAQLVGEPALISWARFTMESVPHILDISCSKVVRILSEMPNGAILRPGGLGGHCRDCRSPGW